MLLIAENLLAANGWIQFTKITASAATVTQWTPAQSLDSQRNSTLQS